jgi:OmpA-OmpF porin, OOP family
MKANQKPIPSRLLLASGAIALSSLAVAGCATTRSMALEQARSAYQQAEQDPEVSTNAPVALHEAQAALERTEHAWDKDHSESETAHLAYVTERKVEIARARAQQKLAEAEMQRLNESRKNVIISARTREADENAARVRQLEQQLAELQARQTERGLVLTLGDVLFETGRADLKLGAQRNLETLASFLKDNPHRDVLVEGYTDNRGSQPYNLELSQRRAEAVRDFLVRNGIGPQRIIARGYGKNYPVAPNNNEAGRQQNRRVEIVILNPGQRAIDRMRSS